MSVQTICNYINPCSRKFHALEDFKKLSCRQKTGIVFIVTLIASTVIFAIAVVPVFRFLVDRCTVDATAVEFGQCVKRGELIQEEARAFQEEARTFLNRGGTLNVITKQRQQQKITIRKTERVITGCSAGINRSQVTAAVLTRKDIRVDGVLPGALMLGMEYMVFHKLPTQLKRYRPENFKAVFGMEKRDQVGREEVVAHFTKETQPQLRLEKVKGVYQAYMDKLGPTHFITFSHSGEAVLKYLLARNGSLEGFTITHIPWDDTVASNECTEEAYKDFGEAVEKVFTIVD